MVTLAIQVCHTLDSPETRTRELAGLIDAMEAHYLSEGMILTLSTEERLDLPQGTVHILPVWKWLLKSLRS